MPDRPDVVVLVDPATRSAVVRVTGPLEHGTAATLRRLVRRAVTAAGPWVTVDLRGCTGLASSAAECLVDEHERLRAWGGALVCEGSPPVLPAPAATGGALPPTDLPDEELVTLLRRALLRRLHADDEPERTAAGRRLLVLLRERERRGGTWPPRADGAPRDRGDPGAATGSTWNTTGPPLVEDGHEHP